MNATIVSKIIDARSSKSVIQIVEGYLEKIDNSYPADDEQFQDKREKELKSLWESIILSPWEAKSLQEGLLTASYVYSAFFDNSNQDAELMEEYPEFDAVYDDLSDDLLDAAEGLESLNNACLSN